MGCAILIIERNHYLNRPSYKRTMEAVVPTLYFDKISYPFVVNTLDIHTRKYPKAFNIVTYYFLRLAQLLDNSSMIEVKLIN